MIANAKTYKTRWNLPFATCFTWQAIWLGAKIGSYFIHSRPIYQGFYDASWLDVLFPGIISIICLICGVISISIQKNKDRNAQSNFEE